MFVQLLREGRLADTSIADHDNQLAHGFIPHSAYEFRRRDFSRLAGSSD
jgi:hypothetical protein